MMSLVRSFFCATLLLICASGASVLAQSVKVAQRDRVAATPDTQARSVLRNEIPAWANGVNDAGTVPAETAVRFTFVLARSAEVQAAFIQLLADQQDPSSAEFHHWLTPQQVGDLYGPTLHDLDAFNAWIQSQGLAVKEIAPSRVFVTVEGTAATVSAALATSFHYFTVRDETHLSAATPLSIPTAFMPIVASIAGLADLPLEPMHHATPMPMQTSSNALSVHPQYTNSTSGSHYVTPGDFATIFDLNAAYSAGLNGGGQRVAIIGRSRVATTDITLFESITGLSPNLPNVVIPTNGVDPGITGNGNQGEATLDVQRVIGTAPGVQADLVVSGSAGGFDGIYVAAQYEVQTLLDPVMTISFGSCEQYAGAGGVSLWDTLFSQAASQGISVFVSSADSGAASCSPQFSTPPSYQFRSINYICASSYATCVGGTQLIDTANSSLYWNSTNTSSLVSARGYIPEGAWNEPGSDGSTVAASTGGGASIYVPKPSWQTGIGVPADGQRDVPDVSFPAASHDGYFGCYAVGGGDCSSNRFTFFSGTSAAAPSMAAVTALLNQKTGGSQGNLNPLLYRIAASTPSAFHDATPASSGIANCTVTIPSVCNNSTPSPFSLVGGLAGYALTTGYDQATGLGSLDVANFITAASAHLPTLASTRLSLLASAFQISNRQTANFTATLTSQTAGKPAGTVQFYSDGATLGSPIPITSGQAAISAVPFPAAGSYLISAVYSGDSVFAASTAPGVSLTVTGLVSTTRVSATPVIFAGVPVVFNATVAPATGSTTIPTGTVRFLLSSATSSSYIATAPLVGGIATTPALPYVGGTYSMSAFYLGDAVYSPSGSSAVPFTAQRNGTIGTLSPATKQIGAGGSARLSYIVNSTNSASRAPNPTGTVQLYANGTVWGSPFDLLLGISPTMTYSTPGDYKITATYSGDSNWLPSTTSASTLTVTSTPASYQISTSSALSLAAGRTSSVPVSGTSLNGFVGFANLNCSVAYSGSGSPGSMPTCSFSNNVLNFKVDSSSDLVNLNIATTLPQVVQRSTLANLRQDGQENAWRTMPTGAAIAASLICLFPLTLRRRVKRAVLTLFSAIFLIVLSGCGGSKSPSAPSTSPTGGTAPGSYVVTITSTTTAAGIPSPAPITLALTVN
ncbi:hypothetical protein BH10ACI4_BH10ACI4_32780 [soil metagenome]